MLFVMWAQSSVSCARLSRHEDGGIQQKGYHNPRTSIFVIDFFGVFQYLKLSVKNHELSMASW